MTPGRSSRRRPAVAVAASALAAGALVACATDARVGAEAGAPASGSGSPALSGTVTVFAAASLTEVVERVAADVEADHPGLDVRVNLGGSSALAQQVVAGAPADVFAAASPTTMRVVTEAGLAPDPAVLARNRLQIAVPPENPGGVTGLADLARDELAVALCAEQVPCGAAAAAALRAAGVTAAPDTLEQDARAALAKVRLGEVDAALVYRTDVLAAGDEVLGIAVPEAEEAVSDYLVAALAEAPNPEGARVVVDALLSTEGREVLRGAGFDLP